MAKEKSRQRRVFLFGAGVSASCGIAVARTLLRECLCDLQQENAAKVRTVHGLLSYLYPSFDPDLKNYPNIEDFLNLLQMAKTFNSEEFIQSSLWPVAKLESAESIILKAVTDYLWRKTMAISSTTILDRFMWEYLRYSDTIVTFNWDITLENALTRRAGDFDILYRYLRKRQRRHISILKPHGSIDWYRASQLPKPAAAEAWKLDNEYVVFPYSDFSEHPSVRTLQPLIVPPVASKEFGADFLKETWRGFYRAISDATELTIIGYSLPKEDQFARLVLRRAIRSNIHKQRRGEKRALHLTVVNPDESVAVTFAQLATSEIKVKFLPVVFEDFAEWILSEE
jgi:SIR2-like domain